MNFKIRQQLLILSLLISMLASTAIIAQGGQASEQPYVHTFTDPTGNWTYVEKPLFPVYFNTSQIGIGKNWSIVVPLVSNRTYHVYCYGSWVSNVTVAKTDYDIYVFNPQGELESEHTEAAGLPEHLGTTVNDALFVPQHSGNYTFVIMNDAKESKAAQQATFMIIENVQTDQWLQHFAEGKTMNNSESFNTGWAYEFVTDQPYLELWVNVPSTLDMYEARLFLMNNEKSPSINGFPLPWELGLYGNRSDYVGGYNFDDGGYRGVAVASCEYSGQSMFLNYTAPFGGKHLYQLVFIGEVGSGTIEFLVKTRFGEAALLPVKAPIRVYPFNPAELIFASNATADLEKANFEYSVDGWNKSTRTEMTVAGKNCSATVPGQEAGVVVQYRVSANDVMKNEFSINGNFTVKQILGVNITAVRERVTLGENVTIAGLLTPENASLPVKVQFSIGNVTEQAEAKPLENGTFSVNFQPKLAGTWEARARIPESETTFESNSPYVQFIVAEPPFYVVYSLFIIVGVAGALAAVAIVYFLKLRNR